jgi:subtilisin family serine protease
VRSSVPFDDYRYFSGTSMAGPHVAGLVALLLDARPDLAGRVDAIESLIASSALALATPERCGGDTSTSIPNNTYGWGRIDAVQLFSGDADSDGATNLVDCAPLDPDEWSAPGPAQGVLVHEDRATFTWDPPADPGGGEVLYDLVRSTAADDLGAATCVVSSVATPAASDPETPEQVFYYVVRARNGCGASLGDGTYGPRSAPGCS